MRSSIAPLIECCLPILRSASASHEIIVAIGHLIVAESEANMRFHRAKSSAARDEDLLAGLEEYELIIEACRDACARFASAPEQHYAQLIRELRVAAQRLAKIPNME